jgi:K+-sensing histidine kinase KdpD
MVSDPDDRKSYLETLRREADRLTHLVENVLRYSRLERSSSPAELETVSVSDWIGRITPRLRSRLAEADLELVVGQSGDGEWRTDPSAMEQVLFNLVDNAAKYVVEADDPCVHLDVQVKQREVVFFVIDHGDGVPEELRDSMFHAFSKSAERAAETAAGVGLGLALVKRTVTALDGHVRYQTSQGGGAQFRIQLPRG